MPERRRRAAGGAVTLAGTVAGRHYGDASDSQVVSGKTVTSGAASGIPPSQGLRRSDAPINCIASSWSRVSQTWTWIAPGAPITHGGIP